MTDDEDEVGYSGSFVYWRADEEGPPGDPHQLYSLFRRPPDSRKGHLALRGLRRPDDALYAKPNDEWGVEYRLLPDGSGGQRSVVDADGLVVAFEYEPGQPLLVFGLVADHVTAVEIEIRDLTIPARLENNGFVAQVESEREEKFHVVLHRADGTTDRV